MVTAVRMDIQAVQVSNEPPPTLIDNLHAQERKDIAFNVLGKVQKAHTPRAMIEKYTEHKEWPVNTFIMMVKVLICAAAIKSSTTFWPTPNKISSHLPPIILPASAIEWMCGCLILNSPIRAPVYPAMTPKTTIRKIPLHHCQLRTSLCTIMNLREESKCRHSFWQT